MSCGLAASVDGDLQGPLEGSSSRSDATSYQSILLTRKFKGNVSEYSHSVIADADVDSASADKRNGGPTGTGRLN